MDVGYEDNATPGQIVAAIANAADISSEYIGQIELYDKVSTVDLPEGMPKALFKVLEKTRVANKAIQLRPVSEERPLNKVDKERKPKKTGAPANKKRPAPSASAKPRKRKIKKAP